MPIKHLIANQSVDPVLLQRAKELRKHMTPAEKKLWQCLRADRLEGYHFRRQQIIGRYIVDFFCYQADLVVELDGAVHLEQVDYDEERTRWLESVGLKVLRFSNREVFGELETVLGVIWEACRAAR